MDVTVDIGPNTTDMLEKLAAQIGVTTNTIFPWFVRQQVIEGVAFFVIGAICILIAVGVLLVSIKKTNGEDGWVAGIVVSEVFLIFLFIGGTAGSSIAISQIYNPEFHAVKTMTLEISKLRGK